ncbi:MAG: glycosyltransferase family 2 protein [Patescibacteria group bacterium]
MNQDKLVSIGLGTRNRSHYIGTALDSLLAQTYRNFELVISDNASTDDTPLICEKYTRKDRRVKYIWQKSNIGHAKNFDFLKENARGEYFMWASDDDKWAPTFIEKCLEALNANPDAVIATANFFDFDDLGRMQKGDPKLFFPFKHDLYGRLKEFILLPIICQKSAPMFGLMRRKKVADCEFKDEPFLDYDFVFHCLTKGRFVLVDEPLFYKRTKNFVLDPNPSLFLRAKRIVSNIKTRFILLFSPLLFPNMIFISRLKILTPGEKFQLIFWNFMALLRLFVWYKA